MDKVLFSEEEHSYKSGGIKYTSVTRLIGKYKPPFKKDHWSSYKALERLQGEEKFAETKSKLVKAGIYPSNGLFIQAVLAETDMGEFIEAKEQILAEWKANNVKATRRGNRYHKAREKNSLANKKEENPFTKKIFPVYVKEDLEEADNYSLRNNLYELEDGYYPELLLWNNGHRVAGQADRVFIETVDGQKVVDVDDYKTNNKITTENKYNNFLEPLNHLPDTKLTLYNLQISCYAWLLEQFGFTVRNLAFHHYNMRYDLKYLKPEVENILKNHLNGLNLSI